MPVTVNTYDGTTTFDNADSWTTNDEFGTLNVVKEGDATTPNKTLATFAMGSWKSVKKDTKQDKQLQFEEALELIKTVDDGKWGNQDSDWQQRADELVEANT